jgi:CRP-like cAMP-binding protein
MESNARKKTQYERLRQVQDSKAYKEKKASESLLFKASAARPTIGRLGVAGGQAQDTTDGSIAANRADHALNRVMECEAKKKTKSILSEWAQRTLLLHPAARNDLQITSLEAELRSLHLLDALPGEILSVDGALRATISVMRLERGAPDEKLVEQDNLCDAFFVVVQGSLQQYVRKDGEILRHHDEPTLYSGQTAGRLLLPEHIIPTPIHKRRKNVESGDHDIYRKPYQSHHHIHTNVYNDILPSSPSNNVFSSSLVVGPQGATLVVLRQSEFELALRSVLEGVLLPFLSLLSHLTCISCLANKEPT